MAADARTLYLLLGLLFIIASAQNADPDSCLSIPYCLQTEANGEKAWCDRSTGNCPPCLYRIENRADRYSCFDKATGVTTCPYTGLHTDCEKRNTPTEKPTLAPTPVPTPAPTPAPATPVPTEETLADQVNPSPTIGNTQSESSSSGNVLSNLETYQIVLIGAGCLIAIIAAGLFGYLGYKPPDDRESDFEKHFHSIASASTGRSDSFDDLESGHYVMSESEDESLNSDDDFSDRGSQESSFLDEINSRRRNKVTAAKKTSPKKVIKKKKKKIIVSDDESEAGLQFGGSESWNDSILDEPASPMLTKKKGKKPIRYSISLSDDETKPKGKTVKKKKKGAAVKKMLVDKKRNKKKQVEI